MIEAAIWQRHKRPCFFIARRRSSPPLAATMFKKNISVSSTHQLSGKDAKELRRSVLKVGAAALLQPCCSVPTADRQASAAP